MSIPTLRVRSWQTGVVVVLAAALSLAAWPADADQRRGRGGRDRGGARGQTPRVPPYVWTGPGGLGPYGIPDARGWSGQGRFGGPVFHGARGWWPNRTFGVRQRFAAPYYGFQPWFPAMGDVWAGTPVGFPSLAGMGAVAGVDPWLYSTPHPFYPPPAFWVVPAPVVPGPPSPAALRPSDSPGVPSATTALEAPGVGGLSFELDPPDAEVWVDGGYAGRADEFGPDASPLALTPGPHRLELRAPGHQPVAVDLQIPAGQVLPYRGALARLP